jgi:transcriptional regulator with XRE-family HTH domain
MLSRQIGSVIKAKRSAKQLTQAELARAAGVSRTVLSRLECGTDLPVQTDVLDKLLHALEINPGLGVSPDSGEERTQARLAQQIRLEQRRNRHLRLALALVCDGQAAREMIEKARGRVRVWNEKHMCSPFYIERWTEILALPPLQLACAMASLGDWEDAMFQNSPWSWAWN